MNKYRYRNYSSQSSKYAEYYGMKIYLPAIDYNEYRFASIYEPRFSNKKIGLSQNQIHLNDLVSLLVHASAAKDYLDWNKVSQLKEFNAPMPKLSGLLPEPRMPEEPAYRDIKPSLLKISEKPCYSKPNIQINFLRNLLPKVANALENSIIIVSRFFYKLRLSNWQRKLEQVKAIKKGSSKYQPYQEDLKAYDGALKNWKSVLAGANKKLNDAINNWQLEKEKFDSNAEGESGKLIALKDKYMQKNKSAIEEVVKIVLCRSTYPDLFPRNFDVNYDLETGILVIDFQLPDFERFEVVEDGKRYDFKKISQNKRKDILDFSLHSIAIRTIYEIAISDEVNAITSVVFNGWLNFIDKTNGNERSEYILSVHAIKNDICNLIIENVNPRECFKALKGIVAKNILEYIPVAPILVVNKNDNRLIEGRDVIEGLSPDDNLAAMAWNDFEHLIRELFEKEFSNSGAEVKITHASHDRGVDAIIYDPDPIRGGKFVVQAKRYTKLVDVSAVRDLYGTIQNEGANRGILVTTSHYGPDAYEFAKNKNITLLTGENLLHLLQKHGYKFRIDVKEARKLLNLK